MTDCLVSPEKSAGVGALCNAVERSTSSIVVVRTGTSVQSIPSYLEGFERGSYHTYHSSYST